VAQPGPLGQPGLDQPMHETPQFVKSNLPSDLRKRQSRDPVAVLD
jgi:hypothetical protein